MLNGLLTALAFVTFSATMATAPDTSSQEIAVERFGLYVVSEDVDRATVFYEKLFGKQPQIKTEGMAGFDVGGGLYAVVSKQKYAPGAKHGDTTTPYIRVKDVFAHFQHVKSFAPESLRTQTVVQEGPFKFFKLVDPDGNLIEFFAVTLPK